MATVHLNNLWVIAVLTFVLIAFLALVFLLAPSDRHFSPPIPGKYWDVPTVISQPFQNGKDFR